MKKINLIGITLIALLLISTFVTAKIEFRDDHIMVVVQEAKTGRDITAMNIISYNVDSSTVWVTGYQDDTGVVKIGHIKPSGSDKNAAILSLYGSGKGTEVQGIFMDFDNTGGKLINGRNNGKEVFTVDSDGNIRANSITTVQGSSGSNDGTETQGATGQFRTIERKLVKVENGLIVSIR